MLDPNSRRKYLRIMRRKDMDNMTRVAQANAVTKLCKSVRRCPFCEAVNGTVKKSGPLKISHEPLRNWKGPDELEEHARSNQNILRVHPDLKGSLDKPFVDLNAQMCLELFSAIPDEVSLEEHVALVLLYTDCEWSRMWSC